MLFFLCGCGGSLATARAPVGPVELEEMRIIATRSDDGALSLEAYDAETLFRRALELDRNERCSEALPLYARVTREFRTSRYFSASAYNSGLCHQRMGDPNAATERFAFIVDRLPDSSDHKHAHFQLLELLASLERWSDLLHRADQTLALEDLNHDERVEAMARRAEALVGLARLDEAARQARSVLAYARHHDDEVRFDHFTAAANFALAETYRLQAEALEVPIGTALQQHEVLEARAALILRAQREYFDTMRFHDADWAAVAGYRIGQMYDQLWQAIMEAPVAPPSEPMRSDELAEYRTLYREELRRLVEPLVRHSITYWELTLMMIERTGIQSPWTSRIRGDLERVRARLLSAPGSSDPAPNREVVPGPEQSPHS